MNPYERLVGDFARLVKQGKKLPLGGFPAPRHPTLPANAPKVLIFSPHPDDECIIGGLPLRLRREARMDVINVAVTLGSKKSRRAERLCELEKACKYLGFGLTVAARSGFERINLESRRQDRASWSKSVDRIAGIIAEAQPRAIFVPHGDDGHDTHIGTHFLVLDALNKLPRAFNCRIIETEFWRAMATPNLMVESKTSDVTDLVTALSCHVGEVRRNPYHLLLPAWMQDNVRRGAELVGKPGATAPDFSFATLYRIQRWNGGKLNVAPTGGRTLAGKTDPAKLFRK